MFQVPFSTSSLCNLEPDYWCWDEDDSDDDDDYCEDKDADEDEVDGDGDDGRLWDPSARTRPFPS